MFAYLRIAEDGHLHTVLRMAGYVALNFSRVLQKISPDEGVILALRCLVEELESQVCLGIRSLGHNEQSRRIFIYAMNQSHLRVIRVVLGIIPQMPSYGIHQCAMIVAASGMHHQPCRFVDDHQVFIFIHDIKRYILGDDVVIISRTIHHHGNDLARLYLITTLHRFAVGHYIPHVGSPLNTVT